MIEVYPNLFVGNENDYKLNVSRQDGWAVVHACKDPYHRQFLGYSSKGAPRGPEYLLARRGDRLALNIVDVKNPNYFSKEGMIDPALDFIDEALNHGLKVLVHCNLGGSRGPAIALIYMASRLGALPVESLEVAEQEFRSLYPYYNPEFGLREHLRQNWMDYCNKR